jgi:ComF family protein
MRPHLRWIHALLDWVCPARCAACDALIPLTAALPFCDLCAVSVEPADPRSAPSLGAERAATLYGGALAQAVRRFKYGARPDLARDLARLLVPLLEDAAPRVDRVVPVPASRVSLRSRGYHPVLELLREVVRWGVALPLSPRALVRVDDRPPQASLSLAERRRLSSRAFSAAPGVDLAGCRVLLVDDVLTTGATARACSRALLRAGADSVAVITLARTP